MGYNTNYRLYSTNDSVLESLIDSDEDESELSCMDLSEDRGVKYAYMYAKWYEHEEEMRAISKKHKGVLFTLHGDGESGEDLWRKYFFNGKMQHAPARIEYDSFDSAKLK